MKKFPYKLTAAVDDSSGQPVLNVGFTHNDMFIHNARLSSCGRFDVPPLDYGLTEEQADLLDQINMAVRDGAEEAISAGCYTIQKALEVEDGGFAGLYFSGAHDLMTLLRAVFADYAAYQANFGE